AAEAPSAPAAAPAPAAVAVDTSSINAEVITMPLMSDTMEEGVIAAWHKNVGDAVESGELLAEIETDKATMDFESTTDGTILYVGSEAGSAIAVGAVLAIIGEADADYKTLLAAQAAGDSLAEPSDPAPVAAAPAPAAQPATSPASPPAAAPAAVATSSNGRVKASPLAKKMAQDKGFNIGDIPGSGEGGRVVKRDVENFVPAAAPAQAAPAGAPASDKPAVVLPTVVGEESFEEKKVSQMRKTIAKRLSGSKFTSPHFYLTMDIDMDKVVEARKSINEMLADRGLKVSFNDMVIKAAAAALRQHPDVNASWQEDTIRYNHHIHVGVAVAVDEGLLVPVIRFADNKSLSHISTEVKDLAKKAISKKLQPSEWEGNTFTISNLGMFGIEEFTAIINPPDACIMAVGAIRDEPVVKNGQIVPGKRMKVTLSCDHRVVDGAVGSRFLQTFQALLQDPVRILA
ncbi:MAG TPA: pyruvate dehydrogenase complex dihydrolipoamide acetyltransferase, partial [Cytophagales bacterium]|nr:pyruvate dehydrogenase complex dihydrolipoamide acetyltransferase [Cytophagales bacterium]